MRREVLTAMCLALSLAAFATVGLAPASAQVVAGWEHEAAGMVHFAFYSGPRQELTVRCRGTSVEVVLYIDSAILDPALAGRPSVVFAVVIDDSGEVQWIESKLVVEPGVTSIGIGGEAADRLTRDIAAASRSIVTSILTEPPKADSVPHNLTQFPIYGAADAIKAAYDGCGIKY